MAPPLLTAQAGPRSAFGPAIRAVLQNTNLRLIQEFFKTWLKLDFTQLASILAIAGTLGQTVQYLDNIRNKIYWFLVRNCTSSISISENDKLNGEVLNWISLNVLEKRASRMLTAHTKFIYNPGYYYRPERQSHKDDHDKRDPIRYNPSYGSIRFIHKGSLILVTVVGTDPTSTSTPIEYESAPIGHDPLLIMCFGRSTQPIKQFIETCRDFAEKQNRAFVPVHSAEYGNHGGFGRRSAILKPKRPMETINFDEGVKNDLLADVRTYLSWKERDFYLARGIPYRRGYLLHGPPGTGKTSLSVALASMFNLPLYQMHLPSVGNDAELVSLFRDLPSRCIIVLEDIDAIGTGRKLDDDDDDEEEEEDKMLDRNDQQAIPGKQLEGRLDEMDNEVPTDGLRNKTSQCTLSGLLNVIDGVASPEGRILIMTTNVTKNLDKALIRPGRIDKIVYMGKISKDSARRMFIRMFESDRKDNTQKSEKSTTTYIGHLASQFAAKLPNKYFTPAQLQGFMLCHRKSPEDAVNSFDAWMVEQRDQKAKDIKGKENAAVRGKEI